MQSLMEANSTPFLGILSEAFASSMRAAYFKAPIDPPLHTLLQARSHRILFTQDTDLTFVT